MVNRRQARILAMQALCQFDALGEDFMPQLDDFLGDEQPPQAVRAYARQLFRNAQAHRASIDEHIQAAARHWELSRMTTVDRNILRTAVCGLLHGPGVPAKVVISEAVEIAKEFGAVESPGFVNGVLDAIKETSRSQNVETSKNRNAEKSNHGTL